MMRRILPLLGSALLGLALWGCANPGTDWTNIKPGVTRAQVEAVLGEPIKSVETATGQIDTYRYNEGMLPYRSFFAGNSWCLAFGTCVIQLPAIIVEGIAVNVIGYMEQRDEIQISYGPGGIVDDTEWAQRQAAAREANRRRREARQQGDEDFCLAANRGDAEAQARMGKYYTRGWTPDGRDGIDRVQAFLWYGLAAKNGHPTAASFVADQKRILTDEEIARAEALLATWTPDPAACPSFAGRPAWLTGSACSLHGTP